jgi:predicted RNA-binding protein YlxR (DUF448 family)
MGKLRIGERTCMGCGRKAYKADLLRFVRNPTGETVLDIRQDESGRGGYLCPNLSCFSLAAKKRRKAGFETRIRIDPGPLFQEVESRLACQAGKAQFGRCQGQASGTEGRTRS